MTRGEGGGEGRTEGRRGGFRREGKAGREGRRRAACGVWRASEASHVINE